MTQLFCGSTQVWQLLRNILTELAKPVIMQKVICTNDIEMYGKTARHHTIWKCWGNFSYRDYFRDEAITSAYELLTSPEWFDFLLKTLHDLLSRR